VGASAEISCGGCGGGFDIKTWSAGYEIGDLDGPCGLGLGLGSATASAVVCANFSQCSKQGQVVFVVTPTFDTFIWDSSSSDPDQDDPCDNPPPESIRDIFGRDRQIVDHVRIGERKRDWIYVVTTLGRYGDVSQTVFVPEGSRFVAGEGESGSWIVALDSGPQEDGSGVCTTVSVNSCSCDLNGDGVNCYLDLQLLGASSGKNYFSSDYIPCVDANRDGEITSAEVLAFLETCCNLADFNCDGFVDFFDYDGYVDAFESAFPTADANGDGFLDFFDYDLFVDLFENGESC
jgi:hypothetical protein